MSRRVFEFRPDNRHRDWRLAGRGNRHRCGDCSGQEDGQILVSTSPLQTKKESCERQETVDVSRVITSASSQRSQEAFSHNSFIQK